MQNRRVPSFEPDHTTMRTLDWRERNQWIADLLKQRFGDEARLRAWLANQGINGYPQMLLVMERFGYLAFLVASADELIDGQYRDRPALRPILDAVLARVVTVGEITVQARKTYISLLTPRRTFAAVQATTKRRVDLGLRLVEPQPGGRLESAASMGSGQ